MWSTGYDEDSSNNHYGQQVIRDSIMVLEAKLKKQDTLIKSILDDIKETSPDIYLKYLDKVKGK